MQRWVSAGAVTVVLVCSAGAHVPARPLASLCLFLRTPMSCHTDQHTTVDSVPMVQRRGSDGAVQCWCGDSAVLYTVSGVQVSGRGWR
jgi:hypothetical protein